MLPAGSPPAWRSALQGWLAEAGHSGGPLELLFRATRDGMDPESYHQRCDIKGPTLTVARTAAGHVFGGYASVAIRSDGSRTRAPGSFLFALHGPTGLPPTRMALKDADDGWALCGQSANHGPYFGPFNGDLCLMGEGDGEDTPRGCHSNAGRSYELPAGQGPHFLAGEEYFECAEIEVFRVA